MTAPHSFPQRRDQLVRLVARLERGDESGLSAIGLLISDPDLVRSFDDAALRRLILVVKHHRPDLALTLLTHVRTATERRSLGNCLAAIWSRIDINAAWQAISTCDLPASERLELHSAMM